MSDYTELIKSLRCQRIGCGDCPMQDMVMVESDLHHQVWAQHCYAHEAADAIEELQEDNAALNGTVSNLIQQIEEMSKPRWISVTERLPEQGRQYLVIRFNEVTKTQFIDILWHDAHDLWWNRLYRGKYNVTHWMPLPAPPQHKCNRCHGKGYIEAAIGVSGDPDSFLCPDCNGTGIAPKEEKK